MSIHLPLSHRVHTHSDFGCESCIPFLRSWKLLKERLGVVHHICHFLSYALALCTFCCCIAHLTSLQKMRPMDCPNYVARTVLWTHIILLLFLHMLANARKTKCKIQITVLHKRSGSRRRRPSENEHCGGSSRTHPHRHHCSSRPRQSANALRRCSSNDSLLHNLCPVRPDRE